MNFPTMLPIVALPTKILERIQMGDHFKVYRVTDVTFVAEIYTGTGYVAHAYGETATESIQKLEVELQKLSGE